MDRKLICYLCGWKTIEGLGGLGHIIMDQHLVTVHREWIGDTDAAD